MGGQPALPVHEESPILVIGLTILAQSLGLTLTPAVFL